MGKHRHEFVNQFDSSSIAFGINRSLDEKSFIAFLQKFADDDLMKLLVERLSDYELVKVVDYVTGILKNHLTEEEYHRYFLKDE